MQEKLKYDIFLLNVRGIRDQSKRGSIFSYLKDQKAKFYFLIQETFLEPNDETFWKNEWGSDMFFSHGTSHSRGVRILLHPMMTFQIEYSFRNTESVLVCGHKIQGVCKEYSSTKKTVFKGNSKRVYLIVLYYVLNFTLCYYRLKIAASDIKCILINRHNHQWNVMNDYDAGSNLQESTQGSAGILRELTNPTRISQSNVCDK